MIAKVLLLAALSVGYVGSAAGQLLEPDSLTVETGTNYLNDQIRGYGKAQVTDMDGKKLSVFVPVRLGGVEEFLSFYRTEEDLKKFGLIAPAIKVDKVKWLTVNGLYQEHIVLNGELTQLLATRVVDGPVELFYARIQGAMAGHNSFGMTSGGIARTVWFLRREGSELVQVPTMALFKEFADDYFQECPELEGAFTAKGKKLRYQDMVQAVRTYNRYLLRVAWKKPGGK